MHRPIVFIDENIPFLKETLGSCADIILFKGRELKRASLLSAGCEALFVRSTTKVTEGLIDGASVRLIGTATSGFDHVDVGYLESQGITFAYAPGSNANSVAEYVIYSLLNWLAKHSLKPQDTKIGIIGFGNIGSLVGGYCDNLSMAVLVNDPPLRDAGFIFPPYVNYSEFNELCFNADIITNHVPLTASGKYPTRNLLGAAALSLVREGSLLIHTSRGHVVDEKSLYQYLRDQKFSASIDVWEGEPNINTALALEAFPSTPHIAGYSYDGKLRGTLMMASAFENFFGLEPEYSKLKTELDAYKRMPPEKFNVPAFILNSLEESRRLNEDTERFKSVLRSGKTSIAEDFDTLRKKYPRRREIL